MPKTNIVNINENPQKASIVSRSSIPVAEISGVYPWEDSENWISTLNEEGIQHLVESLEKYGMQDAILLIEGDCGRNPKELDGALYIMCGRSRFHAAQYTERYKEAVPCIIIQGLETYEKIKNYAIDNNFGRKIIDRDKVSWNWKAHLAIAEKAIAMGYDPENARSNKGNVVTSGDVIKKYPMAAKTLSRAMKFHKKYLEDPERIQKMIAEKGFKKTQIELGVRPKEEYGAKTPSFEKTFPIKDWDGTIVVEWLNKCHEKYGKEFTHYRLGVTFIHKGKPKPFKPEEWRTGVVEHMSKRANELMSTKPLHATHFKVKIIFEDRRERFPTGELRWPSMPK